MNRRQLQLVFVLALVLVSVWLSLEPDPAAPPEVTGQETQNNASDVIKRAWRDRAYDVAVSGYGTVTRVLSDDNDGSRHQRFVLDVHAERTVLVAHNIDLAPRLDDLAIGDRVDFKGVYEWNDRGGVIHWTHHDPQNRRPGGWLKHNGKTYR